MTNSAERCAARSFLLTSRALRRAARPVAAALGAVRLTLLTLLTLVTLVARLGILLLRALVRALRLLPW